MCQQHSHRSPEQGEQGHSILDADSAATLLADAVDDEECDHNASQ
jgi:hypothetical protein